MADVTLVIFTACWITHAVVLPTSYQCDALRRDLPKMLSVFDPHVLFTAECHPAEADLEGLERERFRALACIWPPADDPRLDRSGANRLSSGLAR